MDPNKRLLLAAEHLQAVASNMKAIARQCDDEAEPSFIESANRVSLATLHAEAPIFIEALVTTMDWSPADIAESLEMDPDLADDTRISSLITSEARIRYAKGLLRELRAHARIPKKTGRGRKKIELPPDRARTLTAQEARRVLPVQIAEEIQPDCEWFYIVVGTTLIASHYDEQTAWALELCYNSGLDNDPRSCI